MSSTSERWGLLVMRGGRMESEGCGMLYGWTWLIVLVCDLSCCGAQDWDLLAWVYFWYSVNFLVICRKTNRVCEERSV